MAKRKKQKQPITSIPEEFKDRLETMFGPSVCRSLESTFVERPTTFRVNTIKADKAEVLRELSQAGFGTHKVAWYGDAFILRGKSKRELTELPMYAEGKIYIQSLASMVPPLVLEPQPGEHVLDLTAAPGSKTSQIAAMMDKQGELVANDVNKVRFFKLKHNMEQLGVVVEKDDWQFSLRLEHGASLCSEFPEYFDKILLDAPCSAEARFVEGKPKSFGFWKERKIKEMAYKQRQLLFAAWNALKPGGTLVYSTCTFAPEENEVQISRLLDRNDDVEVVPVSIDGLTALPCITEWKNKTLHEGVRKTLRIKPNEAIEGFYIAKLRKMVH